MVARDRGTPQGSAISPVLANIFLHYAFDAWMAREFPAVPFERYADDAVVHCKSERQAQFVLDTIKKRMAIVWPGVESGQDAHRVLQGFESQRLSRARAVRFPGVTRFGPGPPVMGRVNCLSASSRRSVTTPRRRYVERSGDGGFTYGAEHPSQRSHGRSTQTVQGWVNYYGRFYPSMLAKSLRRIDEYLVRWAMRKYKRLKRPPHAGMGVPGTAWQHASQNSLLTGESYEPTTEWWEPYDERLSRTVLREPGAATPRATHQEASQG